MSNEEKFVLDTLIKNLEGEEFSYQSGALVNVYLTSFKTPIPSLAIAKAIAEEIEKMDSDEEFVKAFVSWSKGRAINHKIMTDVAKNGLIDVNLLFTVV